MVNDPIADMLSRIRNAQAVSKEEVVFPYSKIKYQIAKILEKKDFVKKVSKSGRGIEKKIKIVLIYDKRVPRIAGLKRISKPGQRIYKPAKEIRAAHGKAGLVIVSSSNGLITNKEARKKNLGGELICEIW